MSSALMMVTEAGASVAFCSNFDAPNTVGTSISINASSGSSVRSLVRAAVSTARMFRDAATMRMKITALAAAPEAGQGSQGENLLKFIFTVEHDGTTRVIKHQFHRHFSDGKNCLSCHQAIEPINRLLKTVFQRGWTTHDIHAL